MLAGLALTACSGTLEEGGASRSLPPESPASSLPELSSAATLELEMLKAHNRWRSRFGVPPLEWSPELAAFAEEWARELAPRGLKLRHRPNNPYGENLFASRGGRVGASKVVDAWGAEERYYDPQHNDWWPEAGHFSQVVWHSTRRLGCGVARSGDTEVWVCNYDPRGNLRGERPY